MKQIIFSFLSFFFLLHSYGVDIFYDYADFSKTEEQKADMHFFQYGRFVSTELQLGGRLQTGNLPKYINHGFLAGAHVTYFFNFRFAFQVGINVSQAKINFENIRTYNDELELEEFKNKRGYILFMSIPARIKYYLNEDFFQKRIALLNPYVFVGVTAFYNEFRIGDAFKETEVNQTLGFDRPVGVHGGGGMEMPIFQGRIFLGLQASYHYAKFQYEGAEIKGEKYKLWGDQIVLTSTISLNF